MTAPRQTREYVRCKNRACNAVSRKPAPACPRCGGGGLAEFGKITLTLGRWPNP